MSRKLSEIGEASGIIVSENKFASAHDLRRSFGLRWALRVKPAALKVIMRHKKIETTMKYYAGDMAEETADVLWESYSNQISNREENAEYEIDASYW